MAEYINKYELLYAVDKRNGRLPLWLDEILMEDCKPCDVAPVVHAYWSEENLGIVSLYRCSKCGNKGGSYIYPLEFKYCPDCGAKMDRENDDDEQF